MSQEKNALDSTKKPLHEDVAAKSKSIRNRKRLQCGDDHLSDTLVLEEEMKRTRDRMFEAKLTEKDNSISIEPKEVSQSITIEGSKSEKTLLGVNFVPKMKSSNPQSEERTFTRWIESVTDESFDGRSIDISSIRDEQSELLANAGQVSDFDGTEDEEEKSSAGIVITISPREPVNNQRKTTTQSFKRVDMNAISGLRGILSIHIMIFHSFLYSKWNLNLLGSVQMPFFFLISGYVFGLNEGRKLYRSPACCYVAESTEKRGIMFNKLDFYRRRIARTLPLYYLTNLLCVPLVYLGHSSIQKGTSGEIIAYVLTAFVSTTWLGLPIVLNGPSWFVSTIWFFYWIFPSLLPRLQRLTNSQKQKWIRRCYWIQMGIAVLLHFVWTLAISNIDGMRGIGFYFATYWPPSRLPVFVMGVLAGLLRSDGIPIIESQAHRTSRQWALQSDLSGFAFLMAYSSVTALHNWPFEGVLAEPGFWMQLVLPWWMLQLLSALTFDGGQSKSYKMLTGRIPVAMGRMSYALYLIHEPMRQYLTWILHGQAEVPKCGSLDHSRCRSQEFGCDWYDLGENMSTGEITTECGREWQAYNESHQIPLWSMPILWISSIIAAILLNRLVEEPARKWLRPKQKYINCS